MKRKELNHLKVIKPLTVYHDIIKSNTFSLIMQKSRGYQIRAKLIGEITEQHYEPGRQARSLKMVWRRHVHPIYGISYRSYLGYLRYLKIKKGYHHNHQLSRYEMDSELE